MINSLSILLNQECDHIFPPLTRAVLRHNTGTEVNRLKYQPFLLFTGTQISRRTVCVRLFRILDLVPNLLRVDGTLTMNRTSWQCATPKDDHRKQHRRDALCMRDSSRTGSGGKWTSDQFFSKASDLKPFLFKTEAACHRLHQSCLFRVTSETAASYKQ